MSASNLNRNLKRSVLGAAHQAQVAYPPGFAQATKQEIEHIVQTFVTPKKFETLVTLHEGEVIVQNVSFDNLMEITIRSRLAWDVRLLAFKKRCASMTTYSAALNEFPWENHFQPLSRIHIKSECTASNVANARAIKESACKILEAKNFLVNAGEETFLQGNSCIPLYISLKNNVLRLEISFAGNPLFMRGYRFATSSLAPLREDISAACIQQTLAWANCVQPFTKIYAPFAGSGTLGFESILEFSKTPNCALPRKFAFEQFAAFRRETFAWLTKKMSDFQNNIPPDFEVYFVERNIKQFEELAGNCERIRNLLNLSSATFALHLKDIFDIENVHHFKNANTFVAMNPPFGMRMGSGMQSVPAFFNRIGKHVNEQATSQSAHRACLAGFILCPSEESWRAFMTGAPSLNHKTTHFMLGGKDIRLCMFRSKHLEH